MANPNESMRSTRENGTVNHESRTFRGPLSQREANLPDLRPELLPVHESTDTQVRQSPGEGPEEWGVSGWRIPHASRQTVQALAGVCFLASFRPTLHFDDHFVDPKNVCANVYIRWDVRLTTTLIAFEQTFEQKFAKLLRSPPESVPYRPIGAHSLPPKPPPAGFPASRRLPPRTGPEPPVRPG